MNQKKKLKKFIYLLTFILTLIYIIYRIFFTLPIHLGTTCIIFALLVLSTEIWESFDFFIYYINSLMTDRESPNIPTLDNISDYPDIDIFIATLNEPEDLLKNTITACQNLDYPQKDKIHIYVCDDGNRTTIKKLANTMNINYITRLNNKNAKAGNYNNALKHSNSPYIVFFDADMAPTTDFLSITLPFFLKSKHTKIGFVQLPQSFKNPDIFQYRFHLENKIPFEQEYFYNSLQLAKNKSNSVIFCGTNALVSRKALEDVNGFATGTLSEDIATGMLIENKGYTCIALNNIAAYGNSVEDFTGFAKQRSRWARGCIQMGKKYKISKCTGLSFKQKLEYHSCISYWYFGIRRLVYLLAPLLFSMFGIIIIDCNVSIFLALWLPTYLLKRFAIDKLENNERSSTWNTIYETILTPILAVETLKELFGFSKTKFEVSPKVGHSSKMSKLNLKVLLFHLIILLLNLTGFVMCIFRLKTANLMVYLLPLIWTLSNVFYLAISVLFDIRYKKYNYKNFTPNKVKQYKY